MKENVEQKIIEVVEKKDIILHHYPQKSHNQIKHLINQVQFKSQKIIQHQF